MNLSFFTAANGASMQMKHMNVTGTNIANVNSYGYKASVAGFSNLMYGNFKGIDPNELYRGAGTLVVETTANQTQGALQDTGRLMDFAVIGDGFFGLYDPADGEITFTRDGSFTASQATMEGEDGEIVWRLGDGTGRFVIDQQGNFIYIDPDVDFSTYSTEDLNIGVFDFSVRDGLVRNGDNGFLNIDKNGGILLGTGVVQQGVIESSNVDLAKEVTKIIEAQRLYSYALKMVQTSDEIETTIIGLRG